MLEDILKDKEQDFELSWLSCEREKMYEQRMSFYLFGILLSLKKGDILVVSLLFHLLAVMILIKSLLLLPTPRLTSSTVYRGQSG